MITVKDLLRFAGTPGTITLQEDTTIYVEPMYAEAHVAVADNTLRLE